MNFLGAFFPMAEIARPNDNSADVFTGSNDLFWALQENEKPLPNPIASYKKRTPGNAAPSHRENFRHYPMAEFKRSGFTF